MRPAELRHLSLKGWKLLVTAFVLVTVMRLALWMLPFTSTRRLAERLGRRSRRAAGPLPAGLVDNRAWAVRSAAAIVPGAACLTQALALQAWLSRSATPSELRIGVTRGTQGIDAHAWLEIAGRAVIGGGELERYVRLPVLEPRAS